MAGADDFTAYLKQVRAHHAELRDIDGVLYANDGDWVESLTALVEHPDGRLAIVDWSQHAPSLATAPVAAPADRPRWVRPRGWIGSAVRRLR